MYFFIYAIIFIFGLITGSFLNCLIYRLEKRDNFLKGRSYCPNCKRILKWQDLIPVLSFILLKGKCRYCGKRISWQYPLVELITGLLFVLIFWSLGFQWSLGIGAWDFINLCFLFIISSFLIIIFVYDLKHYIIPNKTIYPLIGITFLYQIAQVFNFSRWDLGFQWSLGIGIWDFIASAFGAALFFLLVVLITRSKGMGIGDVKLAFFMGLFLGFPDILIALFLAFAIGAIIGIELILARKKTMKSQVPFGPFLIAGTLIAFFWSAEIINWYFSLFYV